MSPPDKPATVTLEDALRLGEERPIEFIDGEIVEKAAPSGEHGSAQGALVGNLFPHFQRRQGSGPPGGWWFATECDIKLGRDTFRPDVAGWRREHAPERPTGRVITLRPDWVCEVLSPTTARRDRVTKLRKFHQAAIPHYWLVDPVEETLLILRYHEAGYINVLSAEKAETVRPEPFDAISLYVGTLFGEDAPAP